jgi:hypothetical protein
MSFPRKTLGLKPESDAFRDFGIVGDGSDAMRKWRKAVNGCSVLGIRPPEPGQFYGVDAGRSGALHLPNDFTLIVEEPMRSLLSMGSSLLTFEVYVVAVRFHYSKEQASSGSTAPRVGGSQPVARSDCGGRQRDDRDRGDLRS